MAEWEKGLSKHKDLCAIPSSRAQSQAWWHPYL